MMAETLAQYSAYMVMQHKYGKDYMHRVLKHFLDQYLRGRTGEVRHEPPLAQVQNEPYVWYQKGGQIMYTLADYIGEDKVDLALHNFLMQYRYANAHNQVDAADSTHGTQSSDTRYPDTRLLVDALRAQTPPDLQYLIDDGFNRIVLYDDKTVSATSKQLPNGKYQVTLDVRARKVQVDSAAWSRRCRSTTTSRSACSRGRRARNSRSTWRSGSSRRSGPRSPLWWTRSRRAPASIRTTSSSTEMQTTT